MRPALNVIGKATVLAAALLLVAGPCCTYLQASVAATDAELSSAVGGCGWEKCIKGPAICGLTPCTCFKVLGVCTLTGIICGTPTTHYWICVASIKESTCDPNETSVDCGYEWVCLFGECNDACTGQCLSAGGCIITPVGCGQFQSCQ